MYLFIYAHSKVVIIFRLYVQMLGKVHTIVTSLIVYEMMLLSYYHLHTGRRKFWALHLGLRLPLDSIWFGLKFIWIKIYPKIILDSILLF